MVVRSGETGGSAAGSGCGFHFLVPTGPLGDDAFCAIPVGRAGRSAVEFSLERARGEDGAIAFLPALFSLLKLARARVLRFTTLTILSVSSIEVEHRQGYILLPDIARLEGQVYVSH